MNTNPINLSAPTRLLHWLIAFMMIMLLVVGTIMEKNELYALYPIHKSVGTIAFGIIILRILWRMREGWPAPLAHYTAIERLMGKVIHYILLIGTIMIPLSGVIMSIAGGHGLAVFGFELVATNPNPENLNEVLALDAAWAERAHNMHGMASNIMIIAIIVHIAGALKHHIKDKDETLRRMLGKSSQ